jgi:hypothetical protein
MYPLCVQSTVGKLFFMEIFTFILSLIRRSHLHCVGKMQGFVILKQVMRVAARVAEMFLK